ncbi:MAG: YraN family protein [Tannerella sp.]|nr:YraN family protein [Tannerella sp.]
MAVNNETGKNGEAVACAYLKTSGYTILHTNWRYHRYELDIVATQGQELVVVEVKTRSTNPLVAPERAINAPKIARIAAAAEAYVCRYNMDLPVRFDVICLINNGHSCTVTEHIEDAFFAPLK